MNRLAKTNVLFGVLIALLVALGVASVIWSAASSGGSAATPRILPFLREPIVLTLIGAILTFLVVERWRRIETEVAELRKQQVSALGEIREDADKLARERIDVATRRAQAIESRIGGLLEEHPWIALITEHDFIPNAPSCRIVLATAQELASEGKRSLLYEYLSIWLSADSDKRRLQGTADDFLDLAEFCERSLGDAHLGLLVLREAYANASNRFLAVPDYLQRLVRYGELSEARRVASNLQNSLRTDWIFSAPDWVFDAWERVRGIPASKYRYHNAVYKMRGFAALALYKQLIGQRNRSRGCLEKAHKLASGMGLTAEINCVEAELYVISGEFERARTIIARVPLGAHLSDDVLFTAYRVYVSIGDVAASELAMSRFVENSAVAEARSHVNVGTDFEFTGSEVDAPIVNVLSDEAEQSQTLNPHEIEPPSTPGSPEPTPERPPSGPSKEL